MFLTLHPSTPSIDAPSPWVQRWSPLISAQGSVLDVACGHGRHARWFARRGHAVTALDRSPEALATLRGTDGVVCVQADIENAAWPLLIHGRPQDFSAVVVTNYLWRPLFDVLRASVQPGGVLIYETFAQGHEQFGKPSRPEFLLAPGELLGLCAGWHIVAYENGYVAQPERYIQRIVAVRPLVDLSSAMPPARYLLQPSG